MPKLTYLIPVGKIDEYLKDALLSINSDPYKDKSILVVDNTNNGDAVEELIDSLGLIVRTEVVKCKERGVAFALNAGIRHLDSEYVARMDADDVIMSGRSEIQISAMVENKKFVGFGSSAEIINSSGRITGCLNVPNVASISEMKSVLRVENPYIHPSIIIKTDILQEYKYAEWADNCQDWELWVRLSLNNNLIGNIKKRLIKYRRHDAQISVNKKINENSAALRKVLENLDSRYAGTYLFQRDYLEARRPSFLELIDVLRNELPKLQSVYAAKKLTSAIARVLK